MSASHVRVRANRKLEAAPLEDVLLVWTGG